MKINPGIFRAFDIRGEYPKDLDKEVAIRIVKAIASFIKPKSIVICRDIRKSSEDIHQPIIDGLIGQGVDVIDIGEVTTEVLYFAVPHLKAGAGLAITASHNPRGWAGIKIIREKGIPVSSDTGLKEIERLAQENKFDVSKNKGKYIKKDVKPEYYKKIESLADISKIKPMKVVIDACNGLAGKLAEPILEKLPIEVVKLNFKPDPEFPKGEPNPLIISHQKEIGQLIKDEQANFGAGLDGDGDRILFFDEHGKFIPNSYIIALLAKDILEKNQNKGKVIHDARLTWIIKEQVKKAGGIPIEIKIGHSFFKEKMRKEDAIFAAESTGHFFYKHFDYADSGLLTLLYMLELFSKLDQPISELIKPLEEKVKVMARTNFTIKNPEQLIQKVEQRFGQGNIEHIDGVTVETDDYRFNLRPSQTEPVVRLNLEAYDAKMLESKKAELISFIESQGGKINS